MCPIKGDIYNEIERLLAREEEHSKIRGYTIKQVADTIGCGRCLDSRLCWKDRDNLPFAAWDGRGNYDIMSCPECTNYSWRFCSHTNDYRENGIRVFHKDNTNWHERIDELFNKANSDSYIIDKVHKFRDNLRKPIADKVEEETKPVEESQPIENKVEEEQPLFEVCKRITRDYTEKSLEVEIEVGKIIDIVKDTVEAYFGNVFSLVDLCKELKVSFSISDSQSINHDKLTRIAQNNYLGIKTTTRVTQNKIKTGLFKKDCFAKEYSADIFILKPLNDAATEKAKTIVSKIATDMTDEILRDF
jgi:hypothetical protein